MAWYRNLGDSTVRLPVRRGPDPLAMTVYEFPPGKLAEAPGSYEAAIRRAGHVVLAAPDGAPRPEEPAPPEPEQEEAPVAAERVPSHLADTQELRPVRPPAEAGDAVQPSADQGSAAEAPRKRRPTK